MMTGIVVTVLGCTGETLDNLFTRGCQLCRPLPDLVLQLFGEKCLLVVKGEFPKTETAGQSKLGTASATAPAGKPPLTPRRLEVEKVQ